MKSIRKLNYSKKKSVLRHEKLSILGATLKLFTNFDTLLVYSQVQEWFRRSEGFLKLCDSVFGLARKIAGCANRELCYDLFTYVWEIASVVSLLSAYVKWLALGQFPTNINSFTQGSYTWFSKGWKETFTSGDQEPWVF